MTTRNSLFIAIAFAVAALIAAPGFAQEQAATPTPEDIVRGKVARSLANLDAIKLGGLMQRLGVQASPEFLDCLCPQEYSFHYYTAGPSGTSCRRIGPLGGLEFSGFVSDRIASCAAAYPLGDGRNVLDVIAQAAASTKAPAPACPAGAGGPILASSFNYAAWPGVFTGISPEQVIWYFSRNDREAVRLMGEKLTRLGNAVIDTTLGLGARSASSVGELATWAKDAGYDILVNNEVDLRLDTGLVEFAFHRNPKTGQLEASEFVVKYAPEIPGANFEMGAGVEHGQWDGRVKFGFSFEKKVRGFQIEGKFGLEYDSNVVPVTSLDNEAPVADQSYLAAAKSMVETLISRINPYIGGAAGPETEIGPGSIALGPEVTKVFRDPSVINRLYSDWVFSDLYASLDQLMVQQKAVEDARHKSIRDLATRLGVQGAECLSIKDATIAIQTAWIKTAQQIGIDTKDRSIKDIREELGKRGFPVR